MIGTIFEVAGLMSILIGIGVIIRLIQRVMSTIQAQRKLERNLREHHKRAVLERLAKHLVQTKFDVKSYDEARRLLIKELEALDEASQKRLWPGLMQPSVQGRVNYCERVLRESAQPEEQEA
ncbi:MAG TPA: hypothetical protein VGN17_30100 [Bryobacteraceae bacterium]|jgi:hypothetical protein